MLVNAVRAGFECRLAPGGVGFARNFGAREEPGTGKLRPRARGGAAKGTVGVMKFEIRVAELRHLVVGVVSGVRDTLRPAKAQVRNRNSEMVVECREVGAATGISHLWLERVGGSWVWSTSGGRLSTVPGTKRCWV